MQEAALKKVEVQNSSPANQNRLAAIDDQGQADAAIDDLRKYGFTIVRNFLRPDQVKDLYQSVAPHLGKAETDYGTSKNKDIVSAMYRTAGGRKVMSAIIGSRYMNAVLGAFQSIPFIEHVKMLVKAGKGPDTPWHQDAAFWTEYDPDKSMISLWIALNPINIQNGCMELMKLNPYLDRIVHHDSVRNGKELQIPDHIINDLKSKGVTVPCELQPGDALIFNATNIHRAFENHSDGVRVALKMAFQDLTKRTPNVKKHPSYMLMRGLSGFLNRTVPCLLTAHRFK